MTTTARLARLRDARRARAGQPTLFSAVSTPTPTPEKPSKPRVRVSLDLTKYSKPPQTRCNNCSKKAKMWMNLDMPGMVLFFNDQPVHALPPEPFCGTRCSKELAKSISPDIVVTPFKAVHDA